MSFVDNHPPQHSSIRDLQRKRNKSKYHKGLIAKLILGKHYAVYNSRQLKALALMNETTIVGYLSHKGYQKHLEQRERIEPFLELENLNNESNENLF